MYEAIAATIRDVLIGAEYHAYEAIKTIADKLADEFAEDNPRFDRPRFLSACGLEL